MEHHWLVLFVLIGIKVALAQGGEIKDVSDEKVTPSVPAESDEIKEGLSDHVSSSSESGEKSSSPVYLWNAPSSIKTAQLGQRVKVPESSTEFVLPWMSAETTTEEPSTEPPSTTQEPTTTSRGVQQFQQVFTNIKQYKSSSVKTATVSQQRVKTPEANNEVDPKTKTPFQSQMSEEERLQKADQALNEFFTDVLQNLSVKMKTGMDEPLGEVLDPVRLDDMQLQPLVAGEVYDVKMRKITVGGLSDYRITQLESQLAESRIKIGIHYPKLYANCLFAANGTTYEIFKVTGRGNATIIFNEVHARTVMYLTKDNGVLQVTSADQPYVDFSSAEILFRDEDASEDSEPVKAESVATQLGPLYFWVLTANAVDKIDYPLALYFNNALKEFPLSDFLQGHVFRQRHMRIHVPHNPIPYAYVAPEQ